MRKLGQRRFTLIELLITVADVGRPTSSLKDSIVFSNGRFAQWPEGQQAD